MALTPGRATAIALIACVAAVAVLLPPAPRRLERNWDYLRQTRFQIGRELQRTRRAVEARLVRDSVRRLTPDSARASTPTLFLGEWDESERAWLDDRVAEIVGDSAVAGSAGIAFVRDTLFRGTPTVYYAMPDGSEPCVAIYAEGNFAPGPWLRRAPYRRGAPAMMGPCAYYARFGRAGPGIVRWLRDGGSALALTSPAFPPPAWKPPPTAGWGRALLSGPVLWFADQDLAFPLALDACMAGRLAACRQFVLDRRPASREIRAQGAYMQSIWAPREDEATCLSDVLVAFGPERFGAFWRSEAPPDQAFASAFGEDLAVWTAGWAHERFGRGPRRTPVTAGAVGWSVAMLAGFLGLAVLVASRRRVAA